MINNLFSLFFVGFIIMTDTLNLINYIHDVKIMMQKIQEGNKQTKTNPKIKRHLIKTDCYLHVASDQA